MDANNQYRPAAVVPNMKILITVLLVTDYFLFASIRGSLICVHLRL